MKKIINTQNAPSAIGPYSQAVEYNGMIYVSGQLPINPQTGEFEGCDIVSQTEQSIENIKAILESAGSSLDNVLKSTIYLANISDFSAMNDVYSKYFKTECPARAAFEVANLPKGALVEIEVVAFK